LGGIAAKIASWFDEATAFSREEGANLGKIVSIRLLKAIIFL
jgi:hypothetical protein